MSTFKFKLDLQIVRAKFIHKICFSEQKKNKSVLKTLMLLVSEQLLRGEGGETFHILIFIDYFHFKLPCSFICPVSVQVLIMYVKYRIQTRVSINVCFLFIDTQS